VLVLGPGSTVTLIGDGRLEAERAEAGGANDFDASRAVSFCKEGAIGGGRLKTSMCATEDVEEDGLLTEGLCKDGDVATPTDC
jgi:hypothetical protein